MVCTSATGSMIGPLIVEYQRICEVIVQGMSVVGRLVNVGYAVRRALDLSTKCHGSLVVHIYFANLYRPEFATDALIWTAARFRTDTGRMSLPGSGSQAGAVAPSTPPVP